MSIRVLIADDHAVVRAGLAAMIANQPDMVVVTEARDGADAVTLFAMRSALPRSATAVGAA